MHLLRYCGAAPVANTDPFGLHYVPPIGDEPDWVHRDPGPVPNDIGAGDQCRSWAFRTWAWHYRWMDRHGNVLPPYNYGCGGTVAFRANYQYGVVHRKPGTECCNNWTEAVKLLARKQSKGERPLLIGVQSASKANPPLSPPCCGINPTAITGFSNFMSWLGTSKWQAFWEDATGPPSNPNSKVRHCRWHKNGRRTYYCIVPNPHNHSPMCVSAESKATPKRCEPVTCRPGTVRGDDYPPCTVPSLNSHQRNCENCLIDRMYDTSWCCPSWLRSSWRSSCSLSDTQELGGLDGSSLSHVHGCLHPQ